MWNRTWSGAEYVEQAASVSAWASETEPSFVCDPVTVLCWAESWVYSWFSRRIHVSDGAQGLLSGPEG